MKNSLSTDKNILEEFNKIYEKETKEIFDIEKSEDEFSILKKNYEKYYEQCAKHLSEIEMNSITEKFSNIENEIKAKIFEIESIEENFKKFMIDEKEEKVFNSESQNLFTEKFLKEFQTVSEENNSIRDKLNRLETRMKSLENQSLDSIKKVKNSYESEDDFYKSEYYKTYFLNKSEFENLLIQIEKKKIIFEEKLETLKTNEFKVIKLKKEFEQIEEQTNQNNNLNQLLKEEINSYKMNLSLIDKETINLENSIDVKKIPQTNKTKVKLILDEENDQEIKKILLENKNLEREIENALMLRADFKCLNKANNMKEEIKNNKRCNILSMLGVILNNKHLLNKKESLSKSIESRKQSLDEIRKIKFALDNLEKSENSLRDSVENIQNNKEKLQSIKLTERKRERILKILKIIK